MFLKKERGIEMIIDTEKILSDLKACPIASNVFGKSSGVDEIIIEELRKDRKSFDSLKIETAIKIKKYLIKLKMESLDLSNKTVKHLEKYNLEFDLKEAVEVVMDNLREEFVSDGYEPDLDLIDVWLDKNGAVCLYSRGDSPVDEKENDMIKIGHIDDNDLYLH